MEMFWSSASVLKLLGSIIVWRNTKTIANRIKIRRKTGRIMPMWAPRQGDGVADSSSADVPSLLMSFIGKLNRSLSIEIQFLKLEQICFNVEGVVEKTGLERQGLLVVTGSCWSRSRLLRLEAGRNRFSESAFRAEFLEKPQ